MPVGTVQNIVSGRKKPMSPEAIARRAERARRVSALGGEAVRRQHAEQRPPVGVVAAAIAERNTGKTLVVETLEQKLEGHPGRNCHAGFKDAWCVYGRTAQLVAAGASKREAVDQCHLSARCAMSTRNDEVARRFQPLRRSPSG